MKTFLSDYLEICLQFRKEALGKPERKQRHSLVLEWAKKQYADDPLTISELSEFWDSYNEYCYNKIFILKVVVPVVNTDLESGDVEGLKFLFQCFKGHEDSYISADSPLAIFCEANGYKYKSAQLADMLLEKEIENMDALKYKYHSLKYYLEFSLHEIPWGVLNGMNGANLSDLPTMLHLVDEFQHLSDKLKISDDSSLIYDCQRFYSAYKEYLQHQERYADFEDYLKKKNRQFS